MVRRNICLTLTGIVALALVVRATPRTIEEVPAPEQRSAAPVFRLTDTAGASRTLAMYRGRVLILDFWATWCTGCKTEIPWYEAFENKYQPPGLSALGVAMDVEGLAVVRPFLRQHPIGYPIVVMTPRVVNDYRVTNLPVTVLIDRHGRIADSHLGLIDRDTWDRHIQQLLREH